MSVNDIKECNIDKKQFAPSLTYQWTSIVLQSLRNAISNLGFHEIVPAPFSSRYEPGAKHSVVVLGHKSLPTIKNDVTKPAHKRVEVVGEQSYYVSVSHVVEKQMAVEHLGKVYCLAPCLRLVMEGEEKSGKHLYTFYQFEIEWKTQSMEDVFSTGEKFLVDFSSQLFKKIMGNAGIEKSPIVMRHLESLMQGNYPRITFSEALAMVGRKAESKGDLTPEQDTYLTEQFTTPFWIYNYPPGVRDSIYHEEPNGIFQTYDLMLPFGYGELTTGGIRPTSGEEIIVQSNILGTSYHPSYAEWKERVQIQTAGFGIGLERLLRFLAGTNSILDFIQHHDSGPNRTLL
jgi:asparaginyl-tRNA synthetase